jgi:hypothetical protein
VADERARSKAAKPDPWRYVGSLAGFLGLHRAAFGDNTHSEFMSRFIPFLFAAMLCVPSIATASSSTSSGQKSGATKWALFGLGHSHSNKSEKAPKAPKAQKAPKTHKAKPSKKPL